MGGGHKTVAIYSCSYYV